MANAVNLTGSSSLFFKYPPSQLSQAILRFRSKHPFLILLFIPGFLQHLPTESVTPDAKLYPSLCSSSPAPGTSDGALIQTFTVNFPACSSTSDSHFPHTLFNIPITPRLHDQQPLDIQSQCFLRFYSVWRVNIISAPRGTTFAFPSPFLLLSLRPVRPNRNASGLLLQRKNLLSVVLRFGSW